IPWLRVASRCPRAALVNEPRLYNSLAGRRTAITGAWPTSQARYKAALPPRPIPTLMLIETPRSALLVIHMQEKVLPAIGAHDPITAHAVSLMRAAERLGVPVAATEQYAKGLGHLIPVIRNLLPDNAIGAKNRFSAVAAGCLPGLPGADRPQIVMI